MVASCCVPRASPWPLHRLADAYAGVWGARRLTWDSSKLTEPLASGGDSLEGQDEKEETSSIEGGREGGGEGRGRGRGGDGSGGRERQGWKPLHLGPPFVRGAEELYSFSKSTLSKDFDLQRFFYRKNKEEKTNL